MMRQEEQSKSTDTKQSGEENEMRKRQRSITESPHYNKLLQLIDDRWEKTQGHPSGAEQRTERRKTSNMETREAKLGGDANE